MATFVDNLGIICLAIDSGENHSMSGRTKLQKMIYFSKYLNWDVDPYRLHFYGPYSSGVADSLNIATDNDIVEESSPEIGPYEYSLTEQGSDFLNRFLTEVCDSDKVEKTRTLFTTLAGYTKDQLELSATLDFVSTSSSQLNRNQIIQKVSVIKDNFSLGAINEAYEIWQNIKHQIQTLQ